LPRGGEGVEGSPAPPTESCRDPLPGAEAVEHRAAAKAAFAQVIVDLAAEIGTQVGARRAGRLVDREVRRRRELQRDTAQSDAVHAVGPQLGGQASKGRSVSRRSR